MILTIAGFNRRDPRSQAWARCSHSRPTAALSACPPRSTTAPKRDTCPVSASRPLASPRSTSLTQASLPIFAHVLLHFTVNSYLRHVLYEYIRDAEHCPCPLLVVVLLRKWEGCAERGEGERGRARPRGRHALRRAAGRGAASRRRRTRACRASAARDGPVRTLEAGTRARLALLSLVSGRSQCRIFAQENHMCARVMALEFLRFASQTCSVGTIQILVGTLFFLSNSNTCTVPVCTILSSF